MSKIAEVRTFTVTVHVNSEHTFEVDARTPEEAESIAEQLIEDGEQGACQREVVMTDAYPV